jgi:hypothetical protein
LELVVNGQKTLQKFSQLSQNTPKLWLVVKTPCKSVVACQKGSKSASAVIVKKSSKNALNHQKKL